MKFLDKEIQEHLFAGGSIKRKFSDTSIHFSQGYLIYGCGIAYLFNERDLKANDWEILNNDSNVVYKLSWEKFKDWTKDFCMKTNIHCIEYQDVEMLEIGNICVDSMGNMLATDSKFKIQIGQKLEYAEMITIITFLYDKNNRRD